MNLSYHQNLHKSRLAVLVLTPSSWSRVCKGTKPTLDVKCPQIARGKATHRPKIFFRWWVRCMDRVRSLLEVMGNQDSTGIAPPDL
jgi:hypothetical protein